VRIEQDGHRASRLRSLGAIRYQAPAMVDPRAPEINLDAYARIAVALARAGAKRDAVLAAHGLDEGRWQEIDDAWQARLSEAMGAVGDDEGVPPLLAEYSAAMERAQADDSQVVPFERFVEATRAVRKGGGDVVKALERLGLSPDAYMRANRHWTQQMTRDEGLAERFRRALG
jgi:hypothetical protein